MDDRIGDLATATELAGDCELEDLQSDPLEVAAAKRANAIDQAWFRRHPTRAYRVRAPVPNEFPDFCRPAVGTERLVVLVKQVRPGTRLRCPLWADQWPSTNDDCLALAWLKFVPERVKQIALDMAAVLLSEGEVSLDVHHALRTPRPPRHCNGFACGYGTDGHRTTPGPICRNPPQGRAAPDFVLVTE